MVKPSNTYSKLTAKELAGVDKEIRPLILEAMDLGCVGRFSNNGHFLIRNSLNQSAATSPLPPTKNRSHKNSITAIRRVIQAQRKYLENQEKAPAVPPVELTKITTVAHALIEYGPAFSSWLDTLDGAGAEEVIRVTGTEDDPVFELLRSKPTDDTLSENADDLSPVEEPELEPSDQEHEDSSRAEPAPPVPQWVCPHCGDDRQSQMALVGHLNSHRTLWVLGPEPDQTSVTTVSEMAHLNQIPVLKMHEMVAVAAAEMDLDAFPVGAVLPVDTLAISRDCDDSLRMPPPTPAKALPRPIQEMIAAGQPEQPEPAEPAEQPESPTAQSAPDTEELLQQIRQALQASQITDQNTIEELRAENSRITQELHAERELRIAAEKERSHLRHLLEQIHQISSL